MDYPKFIISNQKEESMVYKRLIIREHSCSVGEYLTRDQGAAGWSLTSVTAPFITERLFMGRKESNQIKQTKG